MPAFSTRVSTHLVSAAALLAACVGLPGIASAIAEEGPATILIEPTVTPHSLWVGDPQAPGRRAVGAMLDAGGVQSDFVVAEVLVQPEGPKQLDAFLARYAGKVVGDLAFPDRPGADAERVNLPGESPWYRVQLDLGLASLDGLADDLGSELGAVPVAFSSKDAAATVAVRSRARSEGFRVALNWMFQPAALPEHPDGAGGYIDFETLPWMTQDDDPGTPGDQGLSVGVVASWWYNHYKGYTIEGAPFLSPRTVAIIDVGFALDETTGEPELGNLDFEDTPAAPEQYDLADFDGTAGGPAPSPKEWHGQQMFGIAAAHAFNFYGAAGTGGPYVRPMLLKIDQTAATLSAAIGAAAYHGADVINMSLGAECGSLCRFELDQAFFFDRVQQAHDTYGVVLVAAAGNSGRDLGNTTFYPCELSRVICVGAVDEAGDAELFSNFGTGIDIWAPNRVRTTVTPNSAGEPQGIEQLESVAGTSTASAYVSGLVGVLRTLDGDLNSHTTRALLQATANPGVDPKVAPRGILDIYRALRQLAPNLNPEPQIVYPPDGRVISYRRGTEVFVDPGDPETETFSHDYYGLGGAVEVRSDRDGLLCRKDESDPSVCVAEGLSLGTHRLTAEAIDPHEGRGSASITVEAVNHQPQADVSWPLAGSTHFADQLVPLRGSASDSDGAESLVSVEWTSSIDGPLGFGEEILVSLSPGDHLLTLTAVDELGLAGSASVGISVQAGAGIPTALILEPEEGANHGDGVFDLVGEGTDTEDGPLPDSAFSWASDLDGFLGTGRELTVTLSGAGCGTNVHHITLTVTDSDGNAASTTIFVVSGLIC